MKTYSIELKESTVAKMLSPNNVSVPQLAREMGIPRDTLYGWRRQAGGPASRPATSATPMGVLSSEEKFAVVVETATLNELELGAYCRRKGLFAEQIITWRDTCRQANAPLPSKAERAEQRAEREQIQRLNRELQRKDRALAEAAALLVLPKKYGQSGRSQRTLPHPRTAHGGERGDRPGLRRRCSPDACLRRAGTVRAHPTALAPGGRGQGRRTPPRAPRRAGGAHPGQSPLARGAGGDLDGGQPAGICPPQPASDRPGLGRSGALHRLGIHLLPRAARGRPKAPARVRPQPFEATGPNEVWSWDITYLASTVRGAFFYLYLIMDVYSRKIVGWEVYAEESAEHAASVFHKAHLREGVRADALVLHSDNGAPMKGATMLATLQRLGVVPSFSRPAVSNDNPFSESLFNTVKGRPDFPTKPFETPAAARLWVAKFTRWYNDEHLHSALKFVTPAQRHRREDTDLLAQRDALYRAARAAHPTRWSSSTRNWQPPASVLLNPGKPPPGKH